MNHPGPWQLFVKREDNKNLHILAQKEKYIMEEFLFENTMRRERMNAHIIEGASDITSNEYVEVGYVEDYFI